MANLENYWTHENINLLVEKRIARDAVFKKSLTDRLGWIQVVLDMKKEGGSKDLNRVNVRKQWYLLCELYKKCEESKDILVKETFTSKPYYTKLKQFLNRSIHSVKSKCMNQEFRQKMKTNMLTYSSYADRWTEERTNSLIDARIARQYMFKGRGHAAFAWKTVTEDVKELYNDSETLTVQQVKKKWENLFTKYKAMLNAKLFDTKWAHFAKMHEFYTEVHQHKGNKSEESDENSEDNAKLLVESAPKTKKQVKSTPKTKKQVERSPAPLADRWPFHRTKLLIERRIARASMFGRGITTTGWQAIIKDLIDNGAPSDLTVASVKKKWENLLTRHKIIKDSDLEEVKWPYYAQMEHYHSLKKDRKRNKTLKAVFVDVDNVDDDSSTKEELSSAKEELSPEKEELSPEKEELSSEKEELSLANKEISSAKEENEALELDETDSIYVEKLTNCRLCQKKKGEHSLVDDSELCTRIIECTTINVAENLDILPASICGTCKSSLDNFYDFIVRCQDVERELQNYLQEMVIKSENEVVEPQEVIRKSDSLECTECPASFTSAETLDVHLKSHKSSSKFHCEICTAGFKKQSTLYAHIQQHFDIAQVETVDLDMQNIEIEYLIEETGEQGTEIVNAESSELTEDNTEDCEDEMEIIMTNDLYHCELCSKTFTDKKSLKHHFDAHSRIEHHCPREGCNKKFTSLHSLRHHEMRHQGVNSFLCTICGKGFVTKNTLKMHEKIHAEVKEHVCEICNKGFSVHSNLRAHQKKHHEGHRFYCSKCPKEFLTKASLQRHELVHSGVKEFVCDTCSGAFFTLKELKKHQRYHDNVRLFHCKVCFRAFFEKHHLTIHMRCHTGERPFPCTIRGCTKTFREKQKRTRHEKTHHRQTPPA